MALMQNAVTSPSLSAERAVMAAPAESILRIEGLRVEFDTEAGRIPSVAGVDLTLGRGETLALVGESGSGKSVTCLSILGLVQPPGRIAAGRILFRGETGAEQDLARLSERDLRKVRGGEIAMIFQEPMTSLNPLYTVGNQIAEAVVEHRGVSSAEAYRIALEMLRTVGIADPERRLGEYPHQMSGGMRQRVMIGMALSCQPAILIADEPTTALDVTIQAQILELMRSLKQAAGRGMSILFVTHNMGVVAEIADRVAVMYSGRVVESGPVREVFANPRHPYTKGLLASIVKATPPPAREGPPAKPLRAIPARSPVPDGTAAGLRICAALRLRAARNAAPEMPPLWSAVSDHRASHPLPALEPRSGGRALVDVEGLTKHFAGKTRRLVASRR